jgi:hypothetical protein
VGLVARFIGKDGLGLVGGAKLEIEGVVANAIG